MIKLIRWLLILVFGLFLTRAVDLMLVRGAYYRSLADNNRVRKIIIPASRGRILTVDNEKLAQNNVSYFDFNGEKISREKALELEAQEVEVVKEWIREYPFDKMTAHLTGYLGEADEKEVNTNENLKLGSLVGRGGLEEYYDDLLRGEDGEKVIEVGVDEGIIRELGKREPMSGQDLIISLDLDWQRAVWKAMGDKKGAGIVLNPENGGVLGLVSKPSYDPNYFTINRDESEIKRILNNDQLPMLNRAVGGLYPPGSTFKMITAAAGLEEGKISADTKIKDTGVIKVGEWTYANWYWTDYGRKEGMVDLVKAIQRSNDIYFYKVGERVGIESLMDWTQKFGWGQLTGIDLPAESAGLLPTPDWKEKAKGESWFLGNTYHVAIGQGDLTATPLQVAVETAVIASGGQLCTPHLSKRENDKCKTLNVKFEHIDLIKQGMISACSSGGTAFPFFEMNENQRQIACKTGTAEIDDRSDDTHAWFTLFYQPQCPKTSEVDGTASCEVDSEQQVVITLFLERGGSGSSDAAPVAKEIIQRYEGTYEDEKPTPTSTKLSE